MKKKIIVGIAQVLGLISLLFASTACVWIVYRPEIPAELKRA